MANMIRITEFSNKFSDNVFTQKSILNENTPFNVTTGTGTFFAYGREPYYGSFGYLSCTSYNSTGMDFNFGDSLKATVENGKKYLFQMSIYEVSPSIDFFVPFVFYVNVYKNGVFFESIEGNMVSDVSVNSKKTITFFQEIYCDTNTELNFSFTVGADISYPYSTMNFYLGNFKLEEDNKFLGFPTPYSLPIDYNSNSYTGWGYYVDSLATPTITVGTSYTQITIDALGASITDYLPLEIRGVSQLWSGSKIKPIAVGDDYDGRFDVTVTAKSGTPTLIELIIDISGATAGTNVAFTGYIQTGGTIPYKQSIDLDYFTLATFLANGGKIYAKVDAGTITIGRRNIKITRKSKAF